MQMITGLAMQVRNSKKCPRCNSVLLYHWVENRCFTCGYNDYSKDINILEDVQQLRDILVDRSTKYLATPYVVESVHGILNIKKVYIKLREKRKEKNRKWQAEKSSLSAICTDCTDDYNKVVWMDLLTEVKTEELPSRFVLQCTDCAKQVILIKTKRNKISWRYL